jgi:hypothetical protein
MAGRSDIMVEYDCQKCRIHVIQFAGPLPTEPRYCLECAFVEGIENPVVRRQAEEFFRLRREEGEEMTYKEFRDAVKAAGWTEEQLRCDVPPSEALLAFMEAVGLDRYERYVQERHDHHRRRPQPGRADGRRPG